MIIADSSPLISLAIVDEIKLIEKIFGKVIIPKAVYKEIVSLEKPYSKKTEKLFSR